MIRSLALDPTLLETLEWAEEALARLAAHVPQAAPFVDQRLIHALGEHRRQLQAAEKPPQGPSSV